MGAFGSFLGGILSMGGLFLAILVTWTITSGMISFLLFPLFGILGGMALGALNSRKARTQVKYKNEYTAYAAMMFTAIIFLGIYYFIFGSSSVADNNTSDMADSLVVGLALTSGILVQAGLGLVVSNSLAENTGY